MTNSEPHQPACEDAFEAYNSVLDDAFSAIDELENAAYDSSAGSVEVAVSMVDSCLEELEDLVDKYEQAKKLCEGCLVCGTEQVIALRDIRRAREESAGSIKLIAEIIKEIPSDGEVEEELLEELREAAEEYLEAVRSYIE